MVLYFLMLSSFFLAPYKQEVGGPNLVVDNHKINNGLEIVIGSWKE